MMEVKKNFRIAVCLSGQARTWKMSSDNIKKFFTYNRNHEFFKVPIITDFFIHTWDTNTWRYPKEHHQKFYDETHNDGDDIKEVYKPIKMEVQKWDQNLFPTFNAWMPMFYSFEKTVAMKREYELENNFTYDVVIKARLDVIYDPNTQIPFWRINPGHNGLCPGVGYSSQMINKFTYEFNYNTFDDVLFFADSRTIDLIGDLYRSYQHRYTKSEYEDIMLGVNVEPSLYYGPGTLLYDHMIRMGIHPQSIDEHIHYVVVRRTALGLDSINNFNEIRQLFFDWYIKLV